MHKIINDLKQWWAIADWPKRERIILSIIIMIVWLSYLIFWLPITNSINDLKTEITQQRSLLTWMQQAADKIKQLKSIATSLQTLTKDELLTILEQSIKAKNLTQYAIQLKQSDDGKIHISIEHAGFDEIIAWLQYLSKNYSLHTLEFTAKKTDKPGEVKINCVLSII